MEKVVLNLIFIELFKSNYFLLSINGFKIFQLYEVLKILRKMIKQGSSFTLFRVFRDCGKIPAKFNIPI